MVIKGGQKKIPLRQTNKDIKTTTRSTKKNSIGQKREVINHEEQRNTNDDP